MIFKKKPQTPQKKHTTFPASEITRHLRTWFDVTLIKIHPSGAGDTTAGAALCELFVRVGLDRSSSAQRSYFNRPVLVERIAKMSLREGEMPKVTVMIEPVSVATSAPALDETQEQELVGEVAPVVHDYVVRVDLRIGDQGDVLNLMEFTTASGASKCLSLAERGGEVEELRQALEAMLEDQWSEVLADIVSKVAAYNEMELYSKLAVADAGAVAAPVMAQRAPVARMPAAAKLRGGKGSPSSWGWKKTVLVAVGGLIVLYAASAGVTQAVKFMKGNKQGRPALGAVAPDEVGDMVKRQREAIAAGGTDPYSGIDTGNIQIETLKRMGIDVGNPDLGCLAGEK